MKSLEKKRDPMLEGPIMADYPTFHVSDKQMPEIEDWEVGKSYTIKVKVKMIDRSEFESLERESGHATFEVISYETVGQKSLS